MNGSKFERIRTAFWVIYILIPLLTGFMRYQFLPNESYDERTQVLLESHYEDCGPDGMQSCEVPDTWQDKVTGKIYSSSQFRAHRRAEARRLSVITFAYGLVGCLFAAYGSTVRLRTSNIELIQQLGKQYVEQDFRYQIRKKFLDTLKAALITNFIISLFVLLTM